MDSQTRAAILTNLDDDVSHPEAISREIPMILNTEN